VEVNLGATFPHLAIALGSGDDRLAVTVADPAVDPPEPDLVGRIQINAGAGDDVVEVNLGATFPHLAIALGSGDDRLAVTVADPAVGDSAVDPPEPDLVSRIQINAGAGDDLVEIRLPHDRFLLDMDMGPGTDVLRVIVGDPTSLGTGR
jgi:hypothetical protein